MVTVPPRPSGIRAPHGADVFEVSWPDGVHDRLPHRLLRGFCPCAGCQGHSGTVRFVEPAAGPALEIREVQKVGQYALSLKWGDSHSTGIYSFEFLHRLGRWIEALGAAELEAQAILPRHLPNAAEGVDEATASVAKDETQP